MGFSPAGGIWGIQKVRGLAEREFFIYLFFFSYKESKKKQGGRGEEWGPNLAKCPQTFSIPLRGPLEER